MANNGVYQRLLVKLQSDPPEAAREISCVRRSWCPDYALTVGNRYDLDRTFPTHPFFREADWLEKLRRVLCAFALRNADIGYCQGMNFLAGFLLLSMVRIFPTVVPQEYSDGYSRKSTLSGLLCAL